LEGTIVGGEWQALRLWRRVRETGDLILALAIAFHRRRTGVRFPR
jgi:hypothetical protein